MIIPILLYHSVADGAAADGAWGAVSREQFKSHVEIIAASGRQSLTISALAAMLRGERPLVERPVAVTFDDGYDDTLAAVELLRDHGLGATVYVTTGQLGAGGHISAADVQALTALGGVEVGAHGVRHERLDELSRLELQHEVTSSKRQLEDLASERIDSFAYPHGAYDGRVRAAVVDAGYRSAAAVKNAVSHHDDDPFALARYTVTAATAAERVADVLGGKGVPLAWTGERVRTRAYRIARRSRRRLRTAGGQPC